MLVLAIFALLFVLLWLIFLGAAHPLQRGLHHLAHRTAAFRYRDYLPVGLLMAGGFALTIFVGDAFVDVAELVQGQSPYLESVDRRVHTWAASQRSGGATLFFTIFTVVGTPVGLGVVVVIVAALLVMSGRYRWAAYLVITTGIGSLLVVVLKLYFARARPDLSAALRHAQGYSFPSGHAMGSTMVAGALAYLALRGFPTWPAKAGGLAAAVTFIAAVALSRVYLGVHWISDVGAGIAAGTLWVLVTTLSYETFRRIRLVRALRARRSTQ